MTKDYLLPSKEAILDNLDAIRSSLNRCIDEGMLDPDSNYYNELLGLIDDVGISQGWDDLMEVSTRARTLEIDVAAWLAGRGRSTVSLTWPRPPSKK